MTAPALEMDVPTAEGKSVRAVLPSLTCELPGGRIGHFQRGQECMRASIATLLRLPYEEVPAFDSRPTQGKAEYLARWAQWWEWAASIGYRMQFAEPWLTRDHLLISAPITNGARHVIAVVDGREFDPTSGWQFPPGFEVQPIHAWELCVTFEPISQKGAVTR
jgi:hypothetical protein